MNSNLNFNWIQKLNRLNLGYNNNNMGSAQAHHLQERTDSTVILVSLEPTQDTQSLSRTYSDDFLEQPIFIPSIEIRQSPFKNQGRQWKPGTVKIQGSAEADQEVDHRWQTNKDESVAVKLNLWNLVFHDNKIFCIVADMLTALERQCLVNASCRIGTQMYLYQMFHRSNNWDFTFQSIQNAMVSQQKFSYQKMLNQLHEESEHSLDLDRLQMLFKPEEDFEEQINRVDRVMNALHCRGIPYFQGLNCIIVVLVSTFPDELAYWLAVKLIEQTEDIYNRPEVYNEVVEKIEKQLKQKYQQIYHKLEKWEFGVDYFAMKWILGLFSSDLSRAALLHLWDLLLHYGICALVWFTVSVFAALENFIMATSSQDELNQLLKNQISSLLTKERAELAFSITRVFMSQQLYGEGCQQIIKPWKGYEEDTIFEELRKLVQGLDIFKDGKIIENSKISQEEDSEQEKEKQEKQTQYQTIQTIVSEKISLVLRSPPDPGVQKMLSCQSDSDGKCDDEEEKLCEPSIEIGESCQENIVVEEDEKFERPENKMNKIQQSDKKVEKKEEPIFCKSEEMEGGHVKLWALTTNNDETDQSYEDELNLFAEPDYSNLDRQEQEYRKSIF